MKKRQKAAFTQRAEMGRPWWPSRPFGFTMPKRDGTGTQHVPEEAELIRVGVHRRAGWAAQSSSSWLTLKQPQAPPSGGGQSSAHSSPADVVPESLYLVCTMVSGTIQGYEPALHVAYCDDDEATVVAEGSEIPESDPALSEVVVFASKLSQLVRLSNELYSQAGTANQLAQSVSRALVKKIDALLIAQAATVGPATAPSAGLLNTAGIVNGGTIAVDLDGLVDLVEELQSNGSNPTHVVLDRSHGPAYDS